MTLYAIGDIHGHLGKLREAHALIEADRREHGAGEAPVVHVGDLVDRGPESRGVVQHLIDGIGGGAPWVVLKGNHDRLFVKFLQDPGWHDPGLRAELDWLHPALGGRRTLGSYGVAVAEHGRPAEVHAEAVRRVPEAHLDFLAGRPLWHRAGDALFVHAGIRPGVTVEAQAEDDLVWIRGPFLTETADHGALVVHGHTAIDKATHYGNRVNIDSSVAYGGLLTAVAIVGREVFVLTAAGRARLVPVAG